jgi:hypothetical protein
MALFALANVPIVPPALIATSGSLSACLEQGAVCLYDCDVLSNVAWGDLWDSFAGGDLRDDRCIFGNSAVFLRGAGRYEVMAGRGAVREAEWGARTEVLNLRALWGVIAATTFLLVSVCVVLNTHARPIHLILPVVVRDWGSSLIAYWHDSDTIDELLLWLIKHSTAGSRFFRLLVAAHETSSDWDGSDQG